jgi:Ni/Fe-hydrogenase subunit HybB-like protein
MTQQSVAARSTMPGKKQAPSRLFYAWIAILVVVLALGVVGAVLTWARGLEVTGLSDEVPWGLWITADLSAVALGAGSFVVAGLVYLFGAKRFAAVSRVALLIGFLADTGTVLTLLLDLGRPDRFFHPIIYWNTRSLLWVITWSVILYVSILMIELAPALTESSLFARWPKVQSLGEKIHKATPLVAILGVFVSIIHLAATGAAYGIVRGRPLWFEPAMSIVFLTTGIFGGLSVLILVIVTTSRAMKRELISHDLLDELARITGWTIVGCGIIRLINLATSQFFAYRPFLGESTNLLYRMTPYGLAITLGEFLFGMIIPLSIYFNPNLRNRYRNLILAASSSVIGLLLCRWDSTLSGLTATVSYSPSNPVIQYFSYSPSWVEWVTVAGVLAYAALGYTLAVRFLPIFASHPAEPELANTPVSTTWSE